MTGIASVGTTTGFMSRIFSRKRNLLFLTGLIAITAVACGTEDSDPVSSAPVETQAPASTDAPPTNPGGASAASLETIKENLKLDFEVNVYQREDILGGQNLHFSDIVAQGKPVVLNFWAGLCPPCRAEMPELQAVFEEFEDHVILFGLDIGPFTGLGNEQDGRDLIEAIGVTYPAGNTENAKVVSKYKVLGMPSTLFITPDGNSIRSWTGAINEAKLRELVKELIAAS
ncbi:MAG: TlpA family protein disulfide reductase [Chloroflexi bacterium]|nr:TlpA family protein disulfide reductase [Chloroflexota bacterium]